MKKKIKKNIVIFSFLLLFFVLFNFILQEEVFSQRELEIEYPEISELKPEATDIPITYYIKYIFNFTIITIGFIAFAALILFGINLLTSGGDPEKRNKAKKQIRSIILGILILLFSYLILTTINPQLVIFDLAITPVSKESPLITPISTQGDDTFTRVKILAEAVKQVADEIENTAKEIKSLTDNCDCSETEPACICQENGGGSGGGGMGGGGGGMGGGGTEGESNGDYNLDYYGDCSALYCYSSSYNQPCPDYLKIRGNLQRFVDLRDIIIYYKNRALAEAEDIETEINEIINKKIEWYEEKITAEKKVLEQLDEGTEKNLTQAIINSLEDDKDKLEKEKSYKENLKGKLLDLAEEIEKIDDPSTKLAELPEQCLSNVKDKCSGSCSGGCHDTTGCFPAGCSGGNPCPTDDIENRVNEVKSIVKKIKQIADDIIRIINTMSKVEPTKPSCEPSGGTCIKTEQSCSSGYYIESNLPCPEENEQCCLPETLCRCSSPEGSGCVLLADYGITCKDGCYTDPEMAAKLVIFKDCLDRNNIIGWRVTEACPPVVQHISKCHHINGKCVDVNSAVLCNNTEITRQCIEEAGFSGKLNECDSYGPHFHINY